MCSGSLGMTSLDAATVGLLSDLLFGHGACVLMYVTSLRAPYSCVPRGVFVIFLLGIVIWGPHFPL